MRKIFLLLLTIGCALGTSAQEEGAVDFYFSAPQPSGAKDLRSIPEAFHGDFRSDKDSLVTVTITSDSVNITLVTLVIMTLAEINAAPSLRLEDTLLYGIYTDRPVEVLRRNDTLFFGIETKQRMFAVSDSSRIRYCGNDLMMSWQEEKGKWTVMRISIIPRTATTSPGLMFSYVDQSQETELLAKQKNMKIAKSGNHTLLQLDLSIEAMKLYIAGGGFTVKQSYRRTLYH